MPFEHGEPTSVWIWQTPREGEVVPDFPPADITSCIASASFDNGPAESLTPAPLAFDPRRLLVALGVNASAFLRGIGAMRAEVEVLARLFEDRHRLGIRRMHVLYRRRQLARRRRSR